MKKATTEAEKELLDCLYSVTTQACAVHGKQGELDSCAISDYAYGLRLLAEYGRITITAEYGRRVIAKDGSQGE